MPRASILSLAAVLLCAAAPTLLQAQSPAPSPYRVLDRWTIGGEGGWDDLAVDPAAHRLYVTHGTRVEVVDTATGKLVGAISGLQSVHSVALDPGVDPAGRFGYISDGHANAVVVFDRSTLSTVATIPTGENPDAIVFEPATRTVWAFNGRSHSVSVIAPAAPAPGSSSPAWSVVATVPLPGKPEFAVVDGTGYIYDNIEDKSLIVRIDARTRSVTASWPAGCDTPSGLAFDPAGHRLFPVCDGKKMSVVDSLSGKLLASPSIGDGPDGAGFSASRSLAFASSRDGFLSVVDAAAPGYPTIESLPTQLGARTMNYDPSTDRVYLVTAGFGPAPAPSPANPHPRPPVLPGSFTVLVVGR